MNLGGVGEYEKLEKKEGRYFINVYEMLKKSIKLIKRIKFRSAYMS